MRSASEKVNSGSPFWDIKSATSDGRQKAAGEELESREAVQVGGTMCQGRALESVLAL